MDLQLSGKRALVTGSTSGIGFAIAQSLETTEAELMATIVPHPTMSESMHEAVLAAFGRALHI